MAAWRGGQRCLTAHTEAPSWAASWRAAHAAPDQAHAGRANACAPSASDLCDAQDGIIAGNARFLLQHVLATPTVNFVSSPDMSNQDPPAGDAAIRLPPSFFVNMQALALVGIAPDGAELRVPYKLYRETLVACAHLRALTP